jgi:RND family efflux transporter MFP subunit
MATTAMTPPIRAAKPQQRRMVWLFGICVIAGAAFAGWRMLRQKTSADTSLAAFRWVTPQSRSMNTTVNATGIVKLKTGAEVRVGAQLSGIVRRLTVKVGSHVQQGELIAEIDSRPVAARIDQARSQLAQAGVSLAKAQTDYARSQKLFAAGLIAEQQFDDAKAAQDAAKASVAAAQSGLQTAEVDLAYVDIRAPITGTVASIATQQGETVAASFATPTFVTIIQEQALEVIAMVDEADIGNVRRGEEVTFTAETYPDHEFTGTVTRIAPVATVISGVVNYEVAISIARDIALLRPDMTTNVNIRTSKHQALLVPAGCIHKQGGRSFVYLKSPSGAPEKRMVSVAAGSGAEAEVIRGLRPEDEVQLETGGVTP